MVVAAVRHLGRSDGGERLDGGHLYGEGAQPRASEVGGLGGAFGSGLGLFHSDLQSAIVLLVQCDSQSVMFVQSINQSINDALNQ